MPFKRITELGSSKKEIHRTSNFIMYEVTYDGQEGADLQLTSTSSKFDKLISLDIVGTSLEVHVLKPDVTNYEDCELLGTAFSELSEFFDIIKENY